ncbi:hypothetical protein BGX31_006935 [Mortierella sp. GBA43]|nr:hypothetical protein BGX31_006935 [Mortierella sp. GBA43]
MDLLCNAPGIATSSRLTPLEEAELQIIAESLRNTNISAPSSTNTKVEITNEEDRKVLGAVSTRQGNVSSYKNNNPPQPLSQDPGCILMAVADKDVPKVSVQSMTIHEEPHQIQASAVMDDAEVEVLVSKTDIMQSAPCEPTTESRITLPGVVATVPEPLKGYQGNGKANLDRTNEWDPEDVSSVDSSSTTPMFTSHFDIRQQQQYTLANVALEAEGPPPATIWLDQDHFKAVFRELSMYTDQLESLNNQILDAMTLYPPTLAIVPSAASFTTTKVQEEARKRIKGKEKAIHLEEDRDSVAQSFTELVMTSWPQIYKAPPEPKTAQMVKLRTKTAKRLKEAIDTFWGAQGHFENQAQLILEVFQDPAVLEHEDRICILKNQHLNNLLSRDSLDPHDIQQLIRNHRHHQNKLEHLSEQLQNIWLGIFMLLSDPDQRPTTKLSHRMEQEGVPFERKQTTRTQGHRAPGCGRWDDNNGIGVEY